MPKGVGFLPLLALMSPISMAQPASDAATTSSDPPAVQAEPQREVDYPKAGVRLGNGWSTLRAFKSPAICVEFKEESDPAQDRTLDLRRIVDKEQLNRDLSVSVEFQAKAIGGVGGSAKSTYTKSLEVKSESLNIVIIARVLQGARYAAPREDSAGLRLTPAALKLATAESLSNFLQTCGDSYVSAIFSGGELNAFLQFDSHSTDEKESISADIAAGGLTYSGSVSMTETLKKYRESKKLRMLMHSAGGSGDPLPVDEGSLMEAVKNLPANAARAPRNFTIALARYDTLTNWPRESLPALRFNDLEELVAQYHRYNTLYYDMFPMIQKPESYTYTHGVSLASVRQTQDQLAKGVLAVLKARIDDCTRGGSCAMPNEAKAVDYEIRWTLPVAKDSVPEYKQLITLENQRVAAQAAWAQLPDTIKLPITGTRVPSPAKAEAGKRLSAAETALEKAVANYPSALAISIYKQWIETPNTYRCVSSNSPPYCLSNDELDRYLTRIKERTESAAKDQPFAGLVRAAPKK